MTSTWLLILTVFNLVVLSVLTIQVFLKLKEKKEDQRLAKGLQLLQNKISVLQDLSDRTDHQVQKTVQSLEQKMILLQDLGKKSEMIETGLIDAMKKASQLQKDLAKNSQPPPESNQQHMSMQVQAARLAHQGLSREQILEQVNLNPAEVDLILKINKDQLQFAEDQLPTWMHESNLNTKTNFSSLNDFEKTLRQQKEKLSLLRGQLNTSEKQNPLPNREEDVKAAAPAAKPTTEDANGVRPFIFRKIDTRELSSQRSKLI